MLLKTSVATGSVSDLDLALTASFTTNLTGTTITFQDASAGSLEEETKYRMAFAGTGPAIGVITIKLVGNPEPAVPATVQKTARDVFDPPETIGTVTMLDPADDTYERIWKQAVNQGRTQIVDNVGKIDIRAKAEAGYVVNQSVATATDNSLIVNYSWNDANGVAVVSGSVRFDSATRVSTGYTLGSIRVTDNDSGDRASELTGPVRRRR